MTAIVQKILEKIGRPDLPDLLSNRLSSSELNTLLLALFDLKIQQMTPAGLIRQYDLNRLVKPFDLDPILLRKFELVFLHTFSEFQFMPIELSPVAPLGACSVIGTVDQKKVVSALRGTEVLADATNSIALHICHLKKSGRLTGDMVRFSAVERHLRAQSLPPVPGFNAHFKIGCLVTAGLDTGSLQFEKQSLTEQIRTWAAALDRSAGIQITRVKLQQRDGYGATPVLERLQRHLAESFPGLEVVADPSPGENRYYQGVQFKIVIQLPQQEREIEIADGGFVDWPQQLLQNKKERMLCSGLGVEFLLRGVTSAALSHLGVHS